MAAKGRLTVALAGNPNSGKSTIFNNLTGAHQHVGNYPGVTVEKKEGKIIYKDYEITFVDLPGTYSLSAHSEDEVVARNFIITEKPAIVVHVVDASNLERNLYLYTQLQELGDKVILAMNMSDIVEKKGVRINYAGIAGLVGKPVVPTVGSKNKGMQELLDAVIGLYEGSIKTEKIGVDYGEEIKEELEKLSQLLRKEAAGRRDSYSIEWLAVKLLENDSWAIRHIKHLSGSREIMRQNEKSREHLKRHFSDDPEVVIADKRYGFISGACTETQGYSVEERHDFSDWIDKVVLNRFLGLPIFAAVMYAIFKFTFTCSQPIVGWLEKLFEKSGEFTSAVIPEGLTRSFVVDGIIAGLGGVLGFFPLVLFMFFAIAFFEDTGYMARAAFVMDKIMHKFGLHGKSFLPLMISTNGCAVPGLMASRTLDNKKDRLITMIVTPFMICGAKLPIFSLFIGAFFAAEQGANMMFLMYTISVAIALGSAWILKKFVLKGEASHFVMELPPYRIPTMQGLLLKMWERGWLYIKRAGSILLLISIIVWAGFTFPEMKPKAGLGEEVAASEQMAQSYAGRLGKFIEPVVRPLGMDWRGGVALMSGVAAKEVVVSTMGTIYSLGKVDPEESEPLKAALQKDSSWSPLKGLTFLMFCLFYMPCVVATTVFYRETGSSLKWTLLLILGTTIMAWSASFLVYQGGRLLGFGG